MIGSGSMEQRENIKMNVVIPTKDRADTLEWALKTALNQRYPNYTVWVSDNFSSDNTKEVVESFKDERIVYINPGKRLSMSRHWEFALDHVSEGYVMVLGDDDGLYPDAVQIAADLLVKENLRAIAWNTSSYEWPGIGDIFRQPLSDYYHIRQSKDVLNIAKDDVTKTRFLPGLYWGFIDVTLIREIKRRDGSFFHSSVPDYYSASVLSGSIDKYIFSAAPLSISGASLNSTGGAFIFPEKYTKKPEVGFIEESDIPVHSSIVLGTDGITVLADAYLNAADRCAALPPLNMNKFIGLTFQILATCGSRVKYESNLPVLKKIAELNSLDEAYQMFNERYPFIEHKSKTRSGAYSPVLNAIRFFPSDYNIENVFQVSLLGSEFSASRLKRSAVPDKVQYMLSRIAGCLVLIKACLFKNEGKPLRKRFWRSFVGK